MLDLLLVLLAGVGLTLIIVDGTIVLPVKSWLFKRKTKWANTVLKASGCPQCAGFWSGLAVAILYGLTEYSAIPKYLLYGFAVSLLSHLTHTAYWLINHAVTVMPNLDNFLSTAATVLPNFEITASDEGANAKQS